VPVNINELISPIVLTHLLMSSGHYSLAKHMIEMNTYKLTYNDCLRLADSINNLDFLLRKTKAVSVNKERIGKNEVD
jgi:hypothetical protein